MITPYNSQHHITHPHSPTNNVIGRTQLHEWHIHFLIFFLLLLTALHFSSNSYRLANLSKHQIRTFKYHKYYLSGIEKQPKFYIWLPWLFPGKNTEALATTFKRFAKTPRSKELSLEATNAKFNTNTIRILRDTGSHRNTKHSSNPIWPIHHFLESKKFIHFSVCFLLPHKKSLMFPMQLQLRARGLLLRDFFCPVRVIFSQTTYDNLRHRVEIYTLSVNYHITHFDMIENLRPPKKPQDVEHQRMAIISLSKQCFFLPTTFSGKFVKLSHSKKQLVMRHEESARGLWLNFAVKVNFEVVFQLDRPHFASDWMTC